ncbi:hypothetical protein Tco_0653457, partial [Tanacetum coccineum]
ESDFGFRQYSSTRSQQSTRNRGKAIVTSSAPTYDPEPDTITEDDEMSKDKEIDKLMALISLSKNVGIGSTLGDTNITIDSSDICYDRAPDDRDETDNLDQERDLLASLIQKLKCEIDDSKNRNKFLESSNKELVDKLKGEI